MTCIAYDKKGGTISVDSRTSGKGHIYTDKTIKFIHMDDGGIAFFCGSWAKVLEIKQKMREGEDWKLAVDDNVTVVVSYPTGRVEEFRDSQYGHLIDDSEAWGSGDNYALGALFAGATSERAVKAAIRYHGTCGGKVHTFKTKR